MDAVAPRWGAVIAFETLKLSVALRLRSYPYGWYWTFENQPGPPFDADQAYSPASQLSGLRASGVPGAPKLPIPPVWISGTGRFAFA